MASNLEVDLIVNNETMNAIDPETDDDVSHCPWLEQVPGTDRYVCGIHDPKPDHCRLYESA